jgi:hypothetical protein
LDPSKELSSKLQGGDRRSIGRAGKVAADVLADPSLFPALFQLMLDDEPLIRMRAADAVEKVTAQEPSWLQPFKATLLQKVALVEQQEVRWHVAQMLPRLKLTGGEREAVVILLQGYLADKSRIVVVSAMQALADLATEDERLRASVIPLLKTLTETGSPAMRSRGRKLLTRLGASAP